MRYRTSRTNSLRQWSIALLTVVLVGLAVISASPFGRRFLGEQGHKLIGSLGQNFTAQTTQTETSETITTTPGITLNSTTEGYETNRHVESTTYTTDKPFTAVGARWHAAIPAGTNLSLAIRTGTGQTWSAWQSLHLSEDAFVANDPTARVSDLLFVESATQLQFAVDLATSRADRTPRLEQIRFDFMNPDPGPDAPPPTVSADAATSNQPTIISRAQWGADELLMDWAPQYAPVQQIIVHHTAGGTGGSDPTATIRGIYQYHAQTLDWGDIGYNYLIDAQGRIYEGRTGGWGVIGAHAQGYNTGSIGIALLGTYESSAATAQTEQALTQLAAFISAKYDLDPTVTHFFVDKQGPTLGGHRDFGQTLCPGTVEYGRLGTIRSAALAARSSYYSGTNSGTLRNISGNVLAPNTAGTALITIRNTGTATWKNSGSTPVVLQTANPAKHVSALATTGWPSKSEAAVMREASVTAGQTATFSVPLAAAPLGDTTDTFIAAYRGGKVIAGTQFNLTRSVRPELQGQVVSSVDPIKVEGGKTATVEVRIKNTGSKTWVNTGSNPAALNLIDPKGRTSELRDATWPLPYRPTLMDTAKVGPDQEATFTFTLAMPAKSGDYLEPMQAVVDGVAFIPGTAFTAHLVASNPLQSELNERPIVLYATPGEQRTMTLNITNQSSLTWRAAGKGLVALELKNQNSSVLHAAGWISAKRPVQLTQNVAPGQRVSLTYPVQIPSREGNYTETYHLVSDGISPIDGSTFSVTVTVRPAFAAKVLTTTNAVSVAAGSTGRLEIELQNVGSRTWRAEGKDTISVVTAEPLKHDSGFKSGSWLDAHTPTKLEIPTVGPDQVARLSIEVAAGAKNGDSTEKFTLLDASGAAIPGSAFSIKRTTTGQKITGAKGSKIRIGIYNSSSSIAVDATSAYTVVDAAGAELGSAGSGKTTVKWNGSKYALSGTVNVQSDKPPRFVPSGSTILNLSDYQDHPAWNPSLNDNAFRGTIEVRRAPTGKLYAINELPLEDYLRGLAEASNDANGKYMQVLAIAARTYAEYHRANGGKHPTEGFDLDNKNDQQYKGYNLEKRNTKFVEAVDATRGKFVTHKGKVVVTPYFSQSDGHTRAFDQVFGGAVKPWLVSVQVPENQGKPLLGHGVGLDASAAHSRAAAGQTVSQILKYFYTGVELTQLY